MQLSCSPQKIFARHTHRSRPGPDLVPTSVQTQPNQPKWSRLPEKLKFQPCAQIDRWRLVSPRQPVRHGDAIGRKKKGRRKQLTRRKGKRK